MKENYISFQNTSVFSDICFMCKTSTLKTSYCKRQNYVGNKVFFI